MAQIPKFIDITKTFVPVDPNSFPETLTVPGPDASPEERVPAMAYKGYNFMPTPYGYKSYFGVNQVLAIDAIPGNVDDVFIFQNALLENVLIALTDTGVWIKKGEAAGAFAQVVTYTLPTEGVHFLWTSVIIADKLYLYQQGRASYWLVDNHLTEGVTLTEKTPTFLNMAFQVGIFRAAGRLAFWDVTDSIAWANLDDFLDFSPSLETLAGNASFSDVQGRIITVLSHGEGFIIYSSKSIVYIGQDTANLYQWKPVVILPSTGIQYPRQAAVASPDTMHFAYTTEGLKKITKAQPETLVPEITDFIKDSTVPIYIRVLEGRFLFLEMMNGEYIIGKLQHGENTIPPGDYQFDGSSYTLADVEVPSIPGGWCPLIDGISDGEFTDVVPGGPNSPTPAPTGSDAPHPTTPNWQPEWTCWISNLGIKDISNITWGPAPCPTVGPDGKEVKMCPVGVPTIDDLNTGPDNKRAVTGAEAYIDGKWTMERFLAVQNAIWEAEEAVLSEVIATIEGRAKSVSKTSLTDSCSTTPLPATVNSCTLGIYPSAFSDPKFGYNACSFWVTRYLISAREISRKMTNITTCDDAPTEPVVFQGYMTFHKLNNGSTTIAGSIAGAISDDTPGALISEQLYATTSSGGPQYFSATRIHAFPYANVTTNLGHFDNVYKVFVLPEGRTMRNTSVWSPLNTVAPEISAYLELDGVTVSKVETMSAYNYGEDADVPPIPESGFCTITGWSYTKENGEIARMDAVTCSGFNGGNTKPPRTNTGAGGLSAYHQAPIDAATDVPVDPANGDVCGQGIDGFTIDGYEVVWPGSTLVVPASSFLFSLGAYAPLYPTINGAFVYDLHLKKWGKAFLPYKLLLDYSPINSSAGGIVPATVFGILGGVLGTDNKIKLFDTSPADSYITYGKIGYYRLGMTSVEEVRVDFRVPSIGVITVDTSLDGESLEPSLKVEHNFIGATQATLYGAYPGKWVNITISGVYDISYLEYRGFTQGRR